MWNANDLVTINGQGNTTITGNLAVDTDTLFVDSTNNKVGIGTTSPTQALDVTGNIQMAGTGLIQIPDRTTNGTNEIRLGNSSDYRIYHNGSNAVMDNLTGNFFIKSVDDITFQNRTNNEIMAKFRDDDTCELYFDGGTYSTPKLATSATGVTVNGNVVVSSGQLDVDKASYARTIYRASGSAKWSAGLRDSAGGDTNYHIYREGSHTGEVQIGAKVNATGGIEVSNSIFIPDATMSSGIPNNAIKIGDATNGDLRIYHDGANGFVQNSGTGVLRLLGGAVRLYSEDGTELMVNATQNGDVDLYYDGGTYSTPKLSTTASGVQVNGNLDIDTGTLIIDTNADSPNTSYGLQEAIRIDDAGGNLDRGLHIYEYREGGMRYHSLNYNLASGSSGSAYTYTQGNYAGSSMLRIDGAFKFYANAQVTGGSTDVITPTERFRVDTDGADVFGNLAVDTSTLFVDSTNNKVGIGTTSPTKKFMVLDTAMTSTTARDNTVARFLSNASNADCNIQLSNNVDHSAQIGIVGNGAEFYIAQDGIENFRINSSGSVGLKYNGSSTAKLATTANGIDINGTTAISAGAFNANVTVGGRTIQTCLLYTSPSPRDRTRSRMPSSA